VRIDYIAFATHSTAVLLDFPALREKVVRRDGMFVDELTLRCAAASEPGSRRRA
jgi:hypothetical protein